MRDEVGESRSEPVNMEEKRIGVCVCVCVCVCVSVSVHAWVSVPLACLMPMLINMLCQPTQPTCVCVCVCVCSMVLYALAGSKRWEQLNNVFFALLEERVRTHTHTHTHTHTGTLTQTHALAWNSEHMPAA